LELNNQLYDSMLLGYDLGSSFIKVSLVDAETYQILHTERAPEHEMPTISLEPGWAE
jgi:xylulokinase